jgi:hypothetical protein
VHYANVAGPIASLDRIMARNLPVDMVVLGHGAPRIGRGVADHDEQKRYFVALRDEVSKVDFAVPQPSHYQQKSRLDAFLNLFYHQLLEPAFEPTGVSSVRYRKLLARPKRCSIDDDAIAAGLKLLLRVSTASSVTQSMRRRSANSGDSNGRHDPPARAAVLEPKAKLPQCWPSSL